MVLLVKPTQFHQIDHATSRSMIIDIELIDCSLYKVKVLCFVAVTKSSLQKKLLPLIKSPVFNLSMQKLRKGNRYHRLHLDRSHAVCESNIERSTRISFHRAAPGVCLYVSSLIFITPRYKLN